MTYYLTLLKEMTITEFKLRYHGSYLGYLWTLLKPLALFVVLYMVFSIFINVTIPNYQLFLLLGIILWNYFSEATSLGAHALASKAHVIKKLSFPKTIIVLSVTLSSFLGLLINLLIYAGVSIYVGVMPASTMWLFIPLLILFYTFTLGVSLLLSSLYILFKDVSEIWEVLLQVGFWGTPIVYATSFVPENLVFFLFLNPMTGFISYARLLLLDGVLPSMEGVLFVSGTTLVVLLLGYSLFRTLSPLAAERL